MAREADRAWTACRAALAASVAAVLGCSPPGAALAPPRPPAPPPAQAEAVSVVEVAIEVNRLLEPQLDEVALRDAMLRLAERAMAELRGAAGEPEKLAALTRVLLTDRRVTYLSNVRWRDTLLAAPLLRRQGNCLATTTLYVVLGRMLELPIHGVLVPGHAFARLDGASPVNIETTARGAAKPDAHYRRFFEFGDAEASDFGYGRSLSDREFAALLLGEGVSHLTSLGRAAEALALLERAEALWPGSLHLAFARAGLLYETPGRRDDALAFYQEIARAPARHSPAARAAALLALAEHTHVVGDQAEALRLLGQAFELAPRNVRAQVLSVTAACHRALRDYATAALAQNLALRTWPEAGSLVGLAILYKNAGRLDDAIAALREALALNPEDWNARLVLAGYLLRAGREAEGWDLFATVQEPRVDKLLFHTNLAWFFASAGRRKELLHHLAQALALSTTPHILRYIATEADFDPYRADPEFEAVVERGRRRLLGAPAPADGG